MVISEKIQIAEEVKAQLPVTIKIEETKHDPKRDLAYERFKEDKFVTTDYFFTNTQKLSCTDRQYSLYYSLLTNTILTN